MKRFIILLLIAAVIALSLTACDSGDGNYWDGVYSNIESYKNGWLFMEITDCDGSGFGFKFYDSELMYLEGAADIRPNEPYKADYKGITFSINADSGEITVTGSDYGVADGMYARYEDGDLTEK